MMTSVKVFSFYVDICTFLCKDLGNMFVVNICAYSELHQYVNNIAILLYPIQKLFKIHWKLCISIPEKLHIKSVLALLSTNMIEGKLHLTTGDMTCWKKPSTKIDRKNPPFFHRIKQKHFLFLYKWSVHSVTCPTVFMFLKMTLINIKLSIISEMINLSIKRCLSLTCHFKIP